MKLLSLFPRLIKTACCLWQANVVKGLKLYEGVFTATQLSKLLDSVNEFREAGRNQELSGESHSLIPLIGNAGQGDINYVCSVLINLTSFSRPKSRGDICSLQQEHQRN